MNNEKHINEIIELMRRDNSADAPADSIKWAKNLFLTRRAEQPSLVRRIAAVLKMDLAPGRAVLGERSAGTTQARQMLFSAGEHAIDLRVTGVKKRYTVSGQILGEGFESSNVVLSSAKDRFEAHPKAGGVFEINDVPAGVYSLTATAEATEIVVEQIEL